MEIEKLEKANKLVAIKKNLETKLNELKKCQGEKLMIKKVSYPEYEFAFFDEREIQFMYKYIEHKIQKNLRECNKEFNSL